MVLIGAIIKLPHAQIAQCNRVHAMDQLDHLGMTTTVRGLMQCFFGILHMTMSQYKSTVHAECSPMYIYICTFSAPYNYPRTKAYFKKIKIRMWRNVAGFNIVLCTFPPGHSSFSNRKAVFLCLPVYSAGRMS